MAVVFGSLPLASRIFLGGWGFDGAAEIGCVCLLAGVYFHIVSRRFPAVPDPAPIFHVADVGVVYYIVMQGGRSCFVPAFDPEACLEAIERHRVTHMFVVPTMLNAMVNHPAFDRYDTSSLRMMVYGASPMPLDLL